jgi:hypothetical protein
VPLRQFHVRIIDVVVKPRLVEFIFCHALPRSYCTGPDSPIIAILCLRLL